MRADSLGPAPASYPSIEDLNTRVSALQLIEFSTVDDPASIHSLRLPEHRVTHLVIEQGREIRPRLFELHYRGD